MKITFGKYKGRDMEDLPESYLKWLVNPTNYFDNMNLSKEIQETAKNILLAKELLKGTESNKTTYVVELNGDIAGEQHYNKVYIAVDTLEQALKIIELKFADNLDPEDDQILVHEVLPSGHKKVVWQFSGWHYNPEDYNVPQGCLLGHEKSLYNELMEDSFNDY